ncbi:MAG TPA: amino acid permease [Xanthobacteraceae bacterium]|nr:amino acid permease [Xanthobacteraceae bacterium]
MAEKQSTSGQISVFDATVLIVGMIIGVGIFALPPLVATMSASPAIFLGFWLLGGLVTLIGVLCYAELGTAFPGPGGEYRYLGKAYGQKLAVLFAWARGTVIQTGAIAAVAFVYGDYMSQLLPIPGGYSSAIHAAIALIVLTAINIAGLDPTKRTQALLTILEVSSLVAVTIAGFLATPAASAAVSVTGGSQSLGAAGLALVFVLFTYGGWNEISYLTNDMKDVRKNLAKTVAISTAIVTLLYLLINYAYLSALGLQSLRDSKAVGVDVLRLLMGDRGASILAAMVVICALSTLNATVLTGARTYYALGRDLQAFAIFSKWDEKAHKPGNALLLQGAIALALIVLGGFAKDGLKSMIEYTAPVFWFFLLLVGIAVFILRNREPEAPNPYRVPLYPITPILFCAACAWLLYSTAAYAGVGSLFGIGVLALGTPLLFLKAKQS